MLYCSRLSSLSTFLRYTNIISIKSIYLDNNLSQKHRLFLGLSSAPNQIKKRYIGLLL